jgi:hypothetical protein
MKLDYISMDWYLCQPIIHPFRLCFKCFNMTSCYGAWSIFTNSHIVICSRWTTGRRGEGRSAKRLLYHSLLRVHVDVDQQQKI